MAVVVRIIDETPSSADATSEHNLALADGQTTLRDLIRARVRDEVERFNRERPLAYKGLVQPEEFESTLNGKRERLHRELDWEQQFERALESFRQRGFLVIMNEEVIEDLDATLDLKPSTEVRFLRLLPLIGG